MNIIFKIKKKFDFIFIIISYLYLYRDNLNNFYDQRNNSKQFYFKIL